MYSTSVDENIAPMLAVPRIGCRGLALCNGKKRTSGRRNTVRRENHTPNDVHGAALGSKVCYMLPTVSQIYVPRIAATSDTFVTVLRVNHAHAQLKKQACLRMGTTATVSEIFLAGHWSVRSVLTRIDFVVSVAVAS